MARIHPYHHQQWPPGAAPPPAPAAAPPPNPAALPVTPPPHAPMDNPHDEQVRTIFISGLPADMKERELQNLLRWLPGYEASQVNYKGEFPMGFALFSAPHFAHAAKVALQDMVFDAELKAVLHTEMAKKNLFIKRGIAGDSSPYDHSKRLRTGAGGDYTHAAYASPSAFHPPPTPVWPPHGYMTPPPQPYGPYRGYAVPPVPMMPPTPVPAPSSYVPIQERHTVCFIEFEDVNAAAAVHHNLQGAVIPSSGSIGMRIQFSKNPFGRRKDSNMGVSVGAVPAAPPHAMNGGSPQQMAYQ